MTEPPAFLREGADVYARKNDDYGDSWRKVGEILHLLSNGETIELNTPEDHIAYGLYTRRLDKLARSFNGEFLADEMNFESVEDAHSDEMTYAAMSASNHVSRFSDGQAGDQDREGNTEEPGGTGLLAGLPAATREIFRGVFGGNDDSSSLGDEE